MKLRPAEGRDEMRIETFPLSLERKGQIRLTTAAGNQVKEGKHSMRQD